MLPGGCFNAAWYMISCCLLAVRMLFDYCAGGLPHAVCQLMQCCLARANAVRCCLGTAWAAWELLENG
eukprot:11184999-Lingulodinium_polyedra.AAC.1